MVVKIQQALASNNAVQGMLIYDEKREYVYEGPITEDVKNLMQDNAKIYCEAEITDTDTGKTFSIEKEVEAQSW